MTLHEAISPSTAIHQLATITPSSRDELIGAIEVALSGSLVSKIDSHNTASLLFILHDSAISYNKYILKVEYGRKTATEKEIDWYTKNKDYDFIPKLVSSKVTTTHSLLLLEYIDGVQTLDSMMKEDENLDSISTYYREAIELDRKIYYESAPRKATLGEMNRLYVDKFTQRIQEAARFDYLRHLIDKDTHVINEKRYHSLNHYIEKINGDATLYEYLMPRELGLIHGDLHGGNILVADRRIYLVDPNGSREMPLEYDYGKILHTVHGHYSAIMDESYLLTQDSGGYIFQLTKPDDKAYLEVEKIFSDSELMRGFYAEAMHFATMLPHHAGNQQETTALFLRTIELFDELCYIMSIK